MAENVSGKPKQLPKSSVNFYERRGEVATDNSETFVGIFVSVGRPMGKCRGHDGHREAN